LTDDLLITLDVDWAPDFAIDFVAHLLADAGVRATWLATHPSAALDRVRNRGDLFELGIHPNFSPGSTHGQTPQAVLAHCLRVVPDATSMRVHGLAQSSAILDIVLTDTPIVAELSVFLPHAPNLGPVEYTLSGRTLYRLPYLWEDDYEYGQLTPTWDPARLLESHRGMKIFNFHPIHVYLNSCTGDAYAEVKAHAEPLTSASEDTAAALVHAGAGTRSFFTALLAVLADSGGGLCVRDVIARF
jgi:hypothetical protein